MAVLSHHDRMGLRWSDARIAVVNGAAFLRACASVMGPPPSRWRITHAKRASAARRTTTTNPATSSSTASIAICSPTYQAILPCATVVASGHASTRGTRSRRPVTWNNRVVNDAREAAALNSGPARGDQDLSLDHAPHRDLVAGDRPHRGGSCTDEGWGRRRYRQRASNHMFAAEPMRGRNAAMTGLRAAARISRQDALAHLAPPRSQSPVAARPSDHPTPPPGRARDRAVRPGADHRRGELLEPALEEAGRVQPDRHAQPCTRRLRQLTGASRRVARGQASGIAAVR